VRVWSLASGSSGNAYLLEADGCQVLVECGLPLPTLEAALGALGSSPGRLSAALVTHDHGDHLRGARPLADAYSVPIYASAGTLAHPSLEGCARLRELRVGEARRIGELEVRPFRVPHDGAEPLAFRIEAQGASVAIVTDLGYVPESLLPCLQDLDLLILEANHDPEMLWAGPYHPRLKRRIAGDLGHLSNTAAGQTVAACGDRAPRQLWLAHLSTVNNSPARAVEQVSAVLRARGLGWLKPRALPRAGKPFGWASRPAAQQLPLF